MHNPNQSRRSGFVTIGRTAIDRPGLAEAGRLASGLLGQLEALASGRASVPAHRVDEARRLLSRARLLLTPTPTED